MAHSLSAKKRVRQNAKRRTINRARKNMIKTQMKKFEQALHSGDLDRANEEFKQTVKKLDKIASQGTLHKNTVARKKSRLARMLKALAEKKS